MLNEGRIIKVVQVLYEAPNGSFASIINNKK